MDSTRFLLQYRTFGKVSLSKCSSAKRSTAKSIVRIHSKAVSLRVSMIDATKPRA